MLNDPVLVNDWHVVAYAPALVEGKPMAVRLLDEARRHDLDLLL